MQQVHFIHSFVRSFVDFPSFFRSFMFMLALCKFAVFVTWGDASDINQLCSFFSTGLTTIEDTQASSTLDTLDTVNNSDSPVEDRTILLVDNTNSEEYSDSISWNMKTSALIQDFILSHSKTPWLVFTEPFLMNSELPSVTVRHTGEHVLRTSRTYLHSVSVISLTMFESYSSQTGHASGVSSLSVSENMSLSQKNLSSLNNSEISPNKTLDILITNLSQANSLGMSQWTMTSLHGAMDNTAYNSLYSTEGQNVRSFSAQESVFNSPTNFDFSGTTVSNPMTYTINKSLISVSATSEEWAATAGSYKNSGFGLNSTETVLEERQKYSTSLLTSSGITRLNSQRWKTLYNTTVSQESSLWTTRIHNDGISQESFIWKKHPNASGTWSVESFI